MSLFLTPNPISSSRLVLRRNKGLRPLKITEFFNRDNQDYPNKDLGVDLQNPSYEVQSAVNLFNRLQSSLSAKKMIFYGVYQKGNREDMIGCAYVMTHNAQEIGMHYYISPRYRGHGFCQEVQMALIKEISKYNKNARFLAQIKHSFNNASRSILLKNGYKMTGKRLPTKNRFATKALVSTFIRKRVI